MKCPFCHAEDTKVTDSRTSPDSNAVRRRRQCLQCEKRFTTFETIDLTIQVRKRDGKYEDFQMEKLIRGLEAACHHTRISHEEVRNLAAEISSDLLENQVQEIDTTTLGEIVIRKLRKLDTIAYIRFACVYKRFKDMDDLLSEIHQAAGESSVNNINNKLFNLYLKK
ncbi:MAG: transcriptional regulator NrdR [Simkaniaceae bacterium]